MSTPTGGRQTKNERREQAREQARVAREEQKKKERRNRFLVQGGIILAVIAVVAVVAVVIVTSVKPAGPGPRNMASDGLLIEAGGQVHETPALPAGATPTPNPTPTGDSDVIRIQMYFDYLCPYCGQFEATNADYLNTLVDSGAASLELFPVAFLDRASAGSAYPTRAMNAFACIADSAPDHALAFHNLLYENQPEESTTGLSDDEIVAFAKEAGATSDEVETCIREQTFKSWTAAATDRASQLITGTPTIYVNGQQYTGSLTDQATFRQFVAAAQGVQYVEDESATATPTPTPSA